MQQAIQCIRLRYKIKILKNLTSHPMYKIKILKKWLITTLGEQDDSQIFGGIPTLVLCSPAYLGLAVVRRTQSLFSLACSCTSQSGKEGW